MRRSLGKVRRAIASSAGEPRAAATPSSFPSGGPDRASSREKGTRFWRRAGAHHHGRGGKSAPTVWSALARPRTGAAKRLERDLEVPAIGRLEITVSLEEGLEHRPEELKPEGRGEKQCRDRARVHLGRAARLK